MHKETTTPSHPELSICPRKLKKKKKKKQPWRTGSTDTEGDPFSALNFQFDTFLGVLMDSFPAIGRSKVACFFSMLTFVESFARPWPIGSWFGCGAGGVAVWKVDCLLMDCFVLLIFFLFLERVVLWSGG